jgi:hypothetical protein
VQNDAITFPHSGLDPNDANGRLVVSSVLQLRPHPSYVRHNLCVHAYKLAALVELGDLAFQYPLIVTLDRLIIDGYGRWELAKRQGRGTLRCLEFKATEQEALKWLIETHRPSRGLSDFIRIEMALDLEPFFQNQAVLNQQAGGRSKGLSKLTEAERVNSRKEVARVAGVSLGNVHKVKNILANACSSLLEAARTEELSINLADKWSHESKTIQQEQLKTLRIENGIRKKARRLVVAALVKNPVTEAARRLVKLSDIVRRLNELTDSAPERSAEFGSIEIGLVNGPDRAIFMTEELVEAIQPHNEALIR